MSGIKQLTVRNVISLKRVSRTTMMSVHPSLNSK